MNTVLRSALAAAGLAFATQAAAEIVFYENPNFEGRQFTAKREVANFERSGFNDRSSSVAVLGERWEVCENARFQGRCVVLRPGRYPSLAAMGLNDRISSVRIVNRSARVDEARFAPAPVMQDYRRRGQERLFDADVVAVRAVVGAPEQRCWVEREQVSQGSRNIPGAVVGGIIGGILGHQVGSGRGNDVATGIGALAGAAVGSNVNRDSGGSNYSQDVRRCSTVPSQAGPEYYDVTYRYRGQEHRMQMAQPPGRTIKVNGQGEPRA
jgi:uncharacterized protein YcfJ